MTWFLSSLSSWNSRKNLLKILRVSNFLIERKVEEQMWLLLEDLVKPFFSSKLTVMMFIRFSLLSDLVGINHEDGALARRES